MSKNINILQKPKGDVFILLVLSNKQSKTFG